MSVSFSLYPSVFALACEGALAMHGPAPRSPAAQLVGSLPAAAKRALLPIVDRRHTLSPGCLSPGLPTSDTPLAEELDRLRSLSHDDVRTDLERVFADTGVPAHWLSVWRNPRRWTELVALAFDHIGTRLEDAWRRSIRQREREAQRIGTAVARGGIDVALATAHPRGRLRGTALQFPDPNPVNVNASGRWIVLTPMIGRPRAVLCDLDRPDVLWFGYPLAGPSDETQDARSRTELDALLTPIRARLLRFLDRELPMSAVPALLGCTPPTATHHCTQLAKAGLILRRRRGRSVRIARTPRGDQVLEAYARPMADC
ncbi:helix-turn-helix domain-containing protein [Streptomonospora sp. PA3]|uniref:winged helix-turn-helix domain-containing protein n=1 Tax=Streptomonospora sp. PA3 TaxID=2607326 RepID=UPI0031BB4EB0